LEHSMQNVLVFFFTLQALHPLLFSLLSGPLEADEKAMS
jgi:hypothetical protein